VFVLIIGESANRNHMSLYGYPKLTTPKLQPANDVIVYDNVVSAYSNTLNSILSSFTEANLENKIDYSKSISLIDIYRAAGFITIWISNQSPIGIWDNPVTLFAQKADVTKFVNINSSSSSESAFTISYDDKLFPLLNNYLNYKAQRKFIVLHLMGSHSAYSKRYPSSFEKFNDATSKKIKTISEYDNSIYYNDYVVDSLLKIVKFYSQKTNAASAVIYLSDHGENVYDEGDFAGHDYVQKMSKHNVEIPFLVWLSP
jgi:heptose-I-phosphate ethanolaminephosphotransferase